MTACGNFDLPWRRALTVILPGRTGSSTTGGSPGPALPTYVYSRTLPEGERAGVTFARDALPHVRALKREAEQKPLWLWGGGSLFRELATVGLVDGVDVAVIPVLLGGGLPLLPSPGPRLSPCRWGGV